MAPRSRSTDDQSGQSARAEDSAAVAAVETPAEAPAPGPEVAEQAAAPDAASLPDPVGRPPLIEVSEAAARGAFPSNLED